MHICYSAIHKAASRHSASSWNNPQGSFQLLAPFTAYGNFRNCTRQNHGMAGNREADGFVNSAVNGLSINKQIVQKIYCVLWSVKYFWKILAARVILIPKWYKSNAAICRLLLILDLRPWMWRHTNQPDALWANVEFENSGANYTLLDYNRSR